jgi:hypothetical protein
VVGCPERGELRERERADMVIEEARLTLNESVWVPPRPRVFWYAVGAEIRIVEVLKKK